MQPMMLIVLFALLIAAAPMMAVAEESKDKAVATIDKFIAEQKAAGKVDLEDAEWKTKLPKPPKVSFDKGSEYFWIMETNKGKITIKLMPDVAPMHVSSTVYLSRLGFYDGLKFHRVITGFMAQGGCPHGRGFGGPGYKYDGEFDPKVKHDRPYLLSMANAGPGTDGSQFFLTFVKTPWLDGKHTIFGEVVDGKDVVEKLEAAGSEQGQPREALGIRKTSIEVKSKSKE